MLEGFDKDWTAFSSINEASYLEIPSGSYVLKVRYKKDVFNTEYKVFSIPLYILPPWYLSTVAYVIYLLFFILIAGYRGAYDAAAVSSRKQCSSTGVRQS